MKVLRIGTLLNDVEVVDIKEQPLKTLQTMVDGYIEVCTPRYFNDCGIEFLANEEGLLKGMHINENLAVFGLFGPVVVVGSDGDEFVSLSDNQILWAKRYLERLQRLGD